MIVPDVNLLLYAHFTPYAEHLRARAWWEGLVNGTREVGLAAPVLFGFVRLATSRRVFVEPMSVDGAVARAESWLAWPHVHLLAPGPRHAAIALGLLREAGTAGALTTDAQIAAHAVELRGEVHSNDADFGRFQGVRWVNPLR